jgi:hypothetical protein
LHGLVLADQSNQLLQEDASNFNNFVTNLKIADARNAQELSPIHGISKFSHMSQLGFERTLLLDKRPKPSSQLASSIDSPVYSPVSDGLIAADWSGKLTSPVRDQGLCGAGIDNQIRNDWKT